MANLPMSAGLLLALAALPAVPTLFAPFLADDFLHIDVASRFPASLSSGWVLPVETAGAWWTPHGLTVEYFRPLVIVFFAIDRLLYGLHPAGYHLTNLLLHAGTTLLVWGVARHVLGRGFGAWAAAALFAVHPCHADAVDWISGRTDGLAGVFYAGALLFYLESRVVRHRTARFLALSLLSFALALLSKEMAITLPAVILLHACLFPQGETWGRRLLAPASAGVVAALYLALRISVLHGLHPPPQPFAFHFGDPGFFRHLVTAPLLYLVDLVLFILPDPMVTVPFWTAHPLLLAILVAVVATVFAGTMRRAPNARTRAWGLAWMGITLLPVLPLPVGEHFLYVPSMGYCILVGSQLPVSAADVDAPARRGLAWTAVGVVVVALVRTILFDAGAAVANRAVDETVAALDRDESARTVLVVDVPASASLTLPFAVHLARPGRQVDVGTLSVAPYLLMGSGPASSVDYSAPNRLELRRDQGFLGSYVERAFEGPHAPFRSGQTVERSAYTVTVLDAPEGVLHAFSVTLHHPESTLVLRNTGRALIALAASSAGSERPAEPGPPQGTRP
jgi:hypothetical protein